MSAALLPPDDGVACKQTRPHRLPRDCLWKFFLPADYQAMKVTEVAQPGKPRQIQAFELRMNIIADATIDLLFTKNRVTLSVCCVCLLSSLYFFFHFLSVIFLPVPAAPPTPPLVFVLMTHHV